MPLDPQVEGLLAEFRKARPKPVHLMTPAEARLAGWVYKHLADEPEDVAIVGHHYIPGPTADLPVRIYRPAEAGSEPTPGLVYFHGGGFVLGNIEICDSFSRALANRTGCTVIAVNYQKAPEHKFPMPLDDCYAATQWIIDNAALVGLDPARIGVAGDSSGGNLAAAVTLRARDEQGPKIVYQVLIYPCVQYGWDTPSAKENAEGLSLERAGMEYFWNHYVRGPDDGADPYCSPLLAESHAGLPPALVICAEYDPLRDDGRNYAARLEAAGVPVKLSLYKGMIHGFLWMAGVLDQAKTALDEIGREVRSALGGS